MAYQRSYPTSTNYLTGVPCPFCKAKDTEQCVTAGKKPFAQQCHASRMKLAVEKGVTLTEHPRTPVDEDDLAESPDPVGNMKIALWYIDKVGGVEQAKFWLDRAAYALRPDKFAVPQNAPVTTPAIVPAPTYWVCPTHGKAGGELGNTGRCAECGTELEEHLQ